MKLRLINLHRQNCSKALYKWKEATDRRNLKMLAVTTEDLQNESQNLENTLTHQKKRRGAMAVRSTNRRNAKLVRVRNMLNRLMLKGRYRQWVANTEYILKIGDAGDLAEKVMQRQKLRNNFIKYRLKASMLKREENILGRVDWFQEVRGRATANDVYQSLRLYCRSRKLAKKFIFRLTNSIDKSMKGESFSTWKQLCSKARQKIFIDNIEELNKRKQDHEGQIEHFKVKIEQNESRQKHLKSKMQQQAHRIMGNFIVRCNARQQGRGFYKWYDVVAQENKKRRFLRKALLYWHRRCLSAGFRTWAERHFRSCEGELAADLDREEQRRRDLQKQREAEERAHQAEAAQLSKDLAAQIALKDQLSGNFDKAFSTLVRRVNDNSYVDKRRHILRVWADFIRQEKNAVNAIGAIARKTLRMEVFQRIRLVARENHLDKEARRKLAKYFNLIKNSNLRKAMVTWRKNSYAECVKSMVRIEMTLQQTLESNDQMMSQVIQTKHARAERIIRLKKLRFAYNALLAMTKQLKELRVKGEVLGDNVGYLGKREALRKWFKRTKVTLYFRKRARKVSVAWNGKLMRTCWDAMLTQNHKDRKFMRKIAQVIRRCRNLDLARAFQHWHHTAQSTRQREEEATRYGSRSLGQILGRMLKRRMQSALYSLRNRAQTKNYKERFLQRAMIHVAEYRVKHFFHKWRHNVDRMNLAELVNTEGDVVIERNQAQRNAKKLREELISSGYDPEYIDEYLAQKSLGQRGNMQKAVVGLFFRNTEFNIIPKALNQWKAYVASRKRARETARYAINLMNHPLTIYFKRWKYEKADSEKVLARLSKKQLIDKVVADENLIGSSKSRIQRMDQAIDHLNIQRDSLCEHFIKGQRLALAKVNNNCHATLFRSFSRWKKHCQDSEQAELADELGRTNEMIAELSQHV